jgi:hypothetical protein
VEGGVSRERLEMTDFENLRFQLAPLMDFDADRLLTGDEDVDGFVLAMALAHNDLKGIHWMNFFLSTHPPADLGEISGPAGQWHLGSVRNEGTFHYKYPAKCISRLLHK